MDVHSYMSHTFWLYSGLLEGDHMAIEVGNGSPDLSPAISDGLIQHGVEAKWKMSVAGTIPILAMVAG